jgi:hypothetical protein
MEGFPGRLPPDGSNHRTAPRGGPRIRILRSPSLPAPRSLQTHGLSKPGRLLLGKTPLPCNDGARREAQSKCGVSNGNASPSYTRAHYHALGAESYARLEESFSTPGVLTNLRAEATPSPESRHSRSFSGLAVASVSQNFEKRSARGYLDNQAEDDA